MKTLNLPKKIVLTIVVDKIQYFISDTHYKEE